MQVIKLNGMNPSEVMAEIEAGNMVYIGDNQYQGGWKLPKSKWFNPFKADKPKQKRDGTREEIVAKHRQYLLHNEKCGKDLVDNSELLKDLHELKGKTLACWCKPLGCHGDNLIELLRAGE